MIEIEFNGYISGAAERYFWKKTRQLGEKALLFGALFMFPMIVVIAISTKFVEICIVYLLAILAIPILSRIPKSKREKLRLLPNRIYTEDDAVVCVTQNEVQRKWIKDVKALREYDEFYELVFSFGNISNRFLCQKNLLVKGTLKDFEELFEGRIERFTKS